MVATVVWSARMAANVIGLALGAALIGLSLRRGAIKERYGRWNRLIV